MTSQINVIILFDQLKCIAKKKSKKKVGKKEDKKEEVDEDDTFITDIDIRKDKGRGKIGNITDISDATPTKIMSKGGAKNKKTPNVVTDTSKITTKTNMKSKGTNDDSTSKKSRVSS